MEGWKTLSFTHSPLAVIALGQLTVNSQLLMPFTSAYWTQPYLYSILEAYLLRAFTTPCEKG